MVKTNVSNPSFRQFFVANLLAGCAVVVVFRHSAKTTSTVNQRRNALCPSSYSRELCQKQQCFAGIQQALPRLLNSLHFSLSSPTIPRTTPLRSFPFPPSVQAVCVENKLLTTFRVSVCKTFPPSKQRWAPVPVRPRGDDNPTAQVNCKSELRLPTEQW